MPMTPSPEALARAIDVLKVRNVVAVAEHLDAFAQERTKYWQQLAAALQDELNLTVPREKREAVEAVLRAAYAREEDRGYLMGLCLDLDRLAGREVGTTLKRVRGTDAD